jgi:serine phosphatase RsbU (regulator of sigma subunit)/ketosteroid isomerase-like protein
VSSEEVKNKALVRRFLEAQAKGNLNVIDEVLTPHFVDHDRLPGQAPDREGYKRAIAEYQAAFSNVRFLVEDQLAEGDKVVSRFIVRATHDRRELMGVAPTGREVTYKAIAIHRIVEGKIVEEWAEGSNISDVMEQRLEQEGRKRERVEQELRVARRIQQASLPKGVPELEGWEIVPYYRPAKEVGGDFYDFHLLSDDRVGLVIGDATGKGVPAALVMSTTCGMLGVAAQTSNSSSPGEVLQRVNDALSPNIAASTFVTCFYAILDLQSGRLRYANAGHNLPCCRHEDLSTELRASGMPLGLMPRMVYEEKETTLAPGDGVLFYSDGLVEAHDPEGEMFSFPRLQALVAEHGDQDEGSLGEFIMEELYSFVGEGWEQEDDITLLTLRRSPSLS